MMRLPTLLRELWIARRAVALIEFAFSLPILVLITCWLFELTNYALVRQQLSQLALQVADNASRIGVQQTVQSVIDEQEINDLFIGANLQSARLDVHAHGRIILSSLEVDPDSPNGQYIHWQRCYGQLNYQSSYGVQGDGKGTTTLPGMGPADARITASTTAPVMFVEIGYQYQPLISQIWVPQGTMTEIAALIVRDNRDTSGTGINPVAGTTPSSCQSYASYVNGPNPGATPAPTPTPTPTPSPTDTGTGNGNGNKGNGVGNGGGNGTGNEGNGVGPGNNNGNGNGNGKG